MSFVNVAPQLVSTAAADAARIGSAINTANTAAAATTQVLAAAQDEVSTAIAALFGSHGQHYQAISAQVAAYQQRFVLALSQAGSTYAVAEAASATPLQNVLDAINAPVQSLTGRPLIGDGANGIDGTGQAGGNGGWLWGNGGNGGSGAPAARVPTAASPAAEAALAATAATVTPAAPAALAAPAAPATTALSLGWVATEVRAALAAMVLPASVAGAGWVAPGAPAAPATRGPLEQAPVGPVATGGRAVAAASASSLVSAVSAASVARGPSPQVPPAAPVAAVASAGSAAANSCRPRGSPRRHAAMLLPVGRYPPTSRHGIGRRTGLPGSPTRGPANSITSAGQPMMPVIADQPIITAIKPAARPAPHFCDVRCST